MNVNDKRMGATQIEWARVKKERTLMKRRRSSVEWARGERNI